MTPEDTLQPRWNEHGLAPAVVQDARTGQVLMLAWMNAEAWQLTQETSQAHFWSRGRQSLWRKGETSGNVQHVVEIRLDCDQDAILLRVEPAGPACHTGERSCFFKVVAGQSTVDGKDQSTVLDQLYQVILDRKQNPQPGSYTAQLFERGTAEIAKKVGEESVEMIVAALGQSNERLVSDAADLLYHSLVLLAARYASWEQVEQVLERRRK
jgi:phosphoribosyl-ATP pyrophosphohydrolase/phosphoribosyl-AMP cyclohydrolase